MGRLNNGFTFFKDHNYSTRLIIKDRKIQGIELYVIKDNNSPPLKLQVPVIFEFQITGGSDSSGFPMRKDVHGPAKKGTLVSKRGIGYKPLRKGQKKRKTVRGNEVTFDMTLINLKVVKYGEAELFKKE